MGESIRSILRENMKSRLLWRVRVQYIVDAGAEPYTEEEELVILGKDINEVIRKVGNKIKERPNINNVDEEYQPRFNTLTITSVSQFEDEVYL